MLKLRRRYHIYAGTFDEFKAWVEFLADKGVKLHDYVQDKIDKCYVINFTCTNDELNMEQINAEWNYGWY